MPTIDGHTRLLGLLGYPTDHSLSPTMHNAAFDALNLNYCYLPLPVAPKGLPAAMAGLVALGFIGVNVTLPHKQTVVPLLDEISQEAEAIGAVNMIEFKNGKRTGHNMDGFGFLKAITERGISVEGFRSLVLGAGGAARAVVYTLLQAGSSVTILNRTEERARSLAESLRVHAEGLTLRSGPLTTERIAAVSSEVDLVVNTTSMGMTPHEEGSPWPDSLPFPSTAIAYDLVYAPSETAFLRTAEGAGACTIGGLQMLVHQGAISLEKWTNRSAPLDVMSCAFFNRRTSP
jgi:shikimate dehydrogenase